uniref:Uncharacterized protein n=1 Tax=Amblyomma aureolatum TaxID=187763 RepID=A0A1E1X022_9ACAR
MGQYLGKPFGDNSALPAQSTPLPARRHTKVLTLSELDPRSPTAEIPRTPIQMEAAALSDGSVEIDTGLDPRSPTQAFQRTPIPLETMLQRHVPQDSPSAEYHKKRPVPPGVLDSPTVVMQRERRMKKSQENIIDVQKQSPASNTSERPALKSTSRPNTMLRSLQESNFQRAGKGNFGAAPKMADFSKEKENCIMPANA